MKNSTGFSKFKAYAAASAIAAGAIACFSAPLPTSAQELGVNPKLDPALVEARREKANPSFIVLAYQHMDELFNTKQVASGPNVWKLEKSDKSLADDAPVTVGGKPTTLMKSLSDLRINAMMVLRDGKIVKEVYRNGGSPSTRYIGMSMSKSWISILTGIAISQGKIGGVEEKVTKYLPELKGTAYDNVTLKNLLMMRAGTSWVEDYSRTAALYKVRDTSINIETAYFEDAAKDLKQIVPPGTKFNYASLETELMGRILERATGRDLADYMSDVLWKPAGMEAPAYWILQGPTGKQHEWACCGIGARVRDFGRLGQMMLNGGAANGKQIVPKAWVDESTNTSDPTKRYYYFWWGTPGIDGFAANGVGSQHVFVDRPSRTVMVITSYVPNEGGALDSDLFKSVLGLLN